MNDINNKVIAISDVFTKLGELPIYVMVRDTGLPIEIKYKVEDVEALRDACDEFLIKNHKYDVPKSMMVRETLTVYKDGKSKVYELIEEREN